MHGTGVKIMVRYLYRTGVRITSTHALVTVQLQPQYVSLNGTNGKTTKVVIKSKTSAWFEILLNASNRDFKYLAK